MTIQEAEIKLKDAGFEISEEQENKSSDEIKEGYVISTNPPSGVNRKKRKSKRKR